MKVKVDKAKCIGCGFCASVCPEVFEMKEEKSHVKTPKTEKPCAKEAADGCPVQCITITK